MIFPWQKPTAEPQDLNVLRKNLSHYVHDLVERISKNEGRRHGGYHSANTGNKGLREGLWMAKQAIRSLSSDWVKISSQHRRPLEHIELLKHVSAAIKTARRTLTKTQKKALTDCLRLLHQERKRLNRTRCPYAHTSAEQRLSEFVDQRRDFVEQLKKTLIAEIYRQDSMSKGERSELCYCLTVIIDIDFRDFPEHTRLNIEPAPSALIRCALKAIEAQCRPLNQLPGNEGVYELAGLNGVTRALQNELESLN